MGCKITEPWVRFQVPSKLTDKEYERWLHGIFTGFLLYADIDNAHNGGHRLACLNQEGSTSPFSVNGMSVGYWKAKLSDDRSHTGGWRGFLFWDHFAHVEKIPDLVLFATEFGKFLESQNIRYDIYIRAGSGEVRVSGL